MRPVDKGQSPYITVASYQDAEPYLEDRLGKYCSYCEMRINNQLAVEHKESKNSGGSLSDWDNLLLSCSYCNARKKEKIKKGEAGKWLWPDRDNTFLAFTYKKGVPALAEEVLKAVSQDAYEKAKSLFEGIALDYRPGMTESQVEQKKYADKRWMVRHETLSVAEESRDIWEKCEDQESKEIQIYNIVSQAKGYGFFSVWMEVFAGVTEVRKALIEAFPGTAKNCFDENGEPVRRSGGIL